MENPTIDDLYVRITEIDKDEEEAKRRHEQQMAWLNRPLRERLKDDPERVERIRKNQRWTFDSFDVPKEKADEIFNEYFELLLDKKCDSLNEFFKERKIKKKEIIKNATS